MLRQRSDDVEAQFLSLGWFIPYLHPLLLRFNQLIMGNIDLIDVLKVPLAMIRTSCQQC
jgi:hypothetical protein